ncbi:SMI1/KNR4 family protein [Paenibacillus tepidiphilus]|uniref:SMI1/KNR4 family protein n=1 Tax=Paenibacillus tepidiphilus TaxID=2608683 RepID=UPI00123ACF59|nr:SMI1/KNR4 family protein [Paenibacillus tepidiphilus]
MNKITWSVTEGPLEHELIQRAERMFGYSYPEDYKDCVKYNDGGYPSPNLFDLPDEESVVFNNLISFTSKEVNIFMYMQIVSEPRMKGLVPFGRDPFGNLICFDYRNTQESPPIVFFDHEEFGEEAIIPVCKSFSDFLDGLYSRE